MPRSDNIAGITSKEKKRRRRRKRRRRERKRERTRLATVKNSEENLPRDDLGKWLSLSIYFLISPASFKRPSAQCGSAFRVGEESLRAAHPDKLPSYMKAEE